MTADTCADACRT